MVCTCDVTISTKTKTIIGRGRAMKTISNFIRVALVSVVVFVNVSFGTNLIFNGDFEQGDTGFDTGYPYSTDGFPEGTYTINTNPRNLGLLWASFSDHTTGAGKMMIVNGATVPNITVWEQTVSVSPNTHYEFSFWLSTAYEYSSNPAELEYFINNVSMGVINAPEQRGVWIQVSQSWHSVTDTISTIKIIDRNIGPGANDFALDDISLIVPEPASLLLLGLGGLLIRKR
jgi:hypothetical protein